MRLDLTDEETFALLNLLVDTIEADRYPMSPHIRRLREILGKFGEIGPGSPELTQKLRRYAPPPPASRRHLKSAILGLRRGRGGGRGEPGREPGFFVADTRLTILPVFAKT